MTDRDTDVRQAGLVLSLFPGIGLLDMAFEAEGFCVVRGPDLLWGGDVHRFNPPIGKFDGVIGGPPCQAFSNLAFLNRARYGEQSIKPNLIPEFERIVSLARPAWFVMENVPGAPSPRVDDYICRPQLVKDVWCGGETNRLRRFTCGSLDPWVSGRFEIETLALSNPTPERTVVATAGGRRATKPRPKGKSDLPYETTRPIAGMLRLQGLPENFFEHSPFTIEGKRIMVGNGVPLHMGRAVAQAIKRSLARKAQAA